jgi:hypothetical protein
MLMARKNILPIRALNSMRDGGLSFSKALAVICHSPITLVWRDVEQSERD